VAKAAERERVIYHYRHALEMLEESGLIPLRLFTVMFPLHQISVRGQERRADDYEELEWFVIQAVGYAQVESVRALKDFYGLDETLIRQTVEVLKSIGHLTESDAGRLTLTQLGRESLTDGRLYEVYESRQVLYFDAFTCHPLPRTHYGQHFFQPGDLTDEDRALYSFEHWRSDALRALARRPDRADYNVPDEVFDLAQLDSGSAYLPMHIIETTGREGKRALRVFTNVRGRHDAFLESLLTDHSEIMQPLLEDQRSPQEAVRWGLDGLGLSKNSYHLDQLSNGTWRVIVPAKWLSTVRSDGRKRLADLGEYILAGEYCVRVWSQDAELRYQAACNRILEKLEHTRRELEPADVRRHIEDSFADLEVAAASVTTLLEEARQRGLGRAEDLLMR
jgi:hypothetical protein